jgi:hypothetical protein
MDQETIQKIAIEIARHLPSYAWMPLLVAAVIMAIAGAVGAFLGEYFKTRGRNLAIQADLDSIKAQLSATTEVVETIKSEVGQKDWARRELTNLRRTKLEALLVAMHDCEAHLDRHRNAALEGKLLQERDPASELRTIGSLYLPELSREVSDFSLAYRELLVDAATLAVNVAEAGSDLNARRTVADEYQVKFNPTRLFQASDALRAAARKLLVKIMGVEAD